jgi:hypothetical protein
MKGMSHEVSWFKKEDIWLMQERKVLSRRKIWSREECMVQRKSLLT